MGLGAVNHMKTAAGVAMTLPWPSRAASSSRSFCLKPTAQPFYEHAIQYNILEEDRLDFFFFFLANIRENNEQSVRVVLSIFLLSGTSADICIAVYLTITTAEQITCSYA